MKTTNRLGEQERGFEVLVHRGEKLPLRYPAKHHPLLTGRDSIKIMRELSKRGFEVVAHTESCGETEELTLSEMEEMVI